MAKPLRSQLNQVRAWVRQGRTDAWIAHQLEVSANELREFRRRHELESDEEDTGEVDLRDEIEAEIEAASEREAEEREAEGGDDDDSDDADADDGEGQGEEGATDEEAGGTAARPPRRRRRGGRGRRGGAESPPLQATFDHGDEEGYGLWLDPAVKDNRVYSEHWAGKREVEVSIEPDRIVIRRSNSEGGSAPDSEADSD